MIERSAEGAALTVVDADALLFPPIGSWVLVETIALLVMVPAEEGTVTVMVIAGAAPAGRVLRVHVTTPALGGLQAQPVPIAPVYVTPEGRVSATETFAASLGPLFVTESV